MPLVVSPEPAHPDAATLLRHLQSWCSPHLPSDVQITGERVALPWRVVHEILSGRHINLSALVPELQLYGHVLADDQGLTVITRAS